jgi:hypothetical protein
MNGNSLDFCSVEIRLDSRLGQEQTYKILFYFLFICKAGVESSPLLLLSLISLIFQPWAIDGDECGAINGINEWQGKPKYWEETRNSAALSNTDHTRFDPGSNQGQRGGKPVTNRLKSGAVGGKPN